MRRTIWSQRFIEAVIDHSPRKKLLIAAPNYWDSPFQVGSHHLARGFVRAGWDVAFISDPISPLHLGRGLTPALRHRWQLHRSGGIEALDGRLWTYVPFAWLTPHGKPILRSLFVHRHWQRWTSPNVVEVVRRRGFGRVDLLYIDSLHQSFWLDAVEHAHAVYRVADYSPQFEKYSRATAVMERDMARRVDQVLYPSRSLRGYVESLGPRRTQYLPNGVDLAHFSEAQPVPAEYARIPGPIAVYVGVLPAWFHFDWLRRAAAALPKVSFVLIGPEQIAVRELAGLANVHLLGFREYARLPAYLQHADVGLAIFDRERNPLGVDVLNPQKFYAYFASGLPVVCSQWDELKRLDSPAHICANADEFIAALRRTLAEPGDRDAHRRFAAPFDWQNCVQKLLHEIGEPALAAA